jgi:hypothetical protein
MTDSPPPPGYSQANGGLKAGSTFHNHGQDPVLGVYDGTGQHWAVGASSRAFVLRVQNFAAAPGLRDGAVVFSYELPDGANTTANAQALHTTFPAFASLAGAASALSWSGDFVQAHGTAQVRTMHLETLVSFGSILGL